jgi:PAS domain S-box-containing protein
MNEYLYKAIFDEYKDPIIICDSNGKVIDANEKAIFNHGIKLSDAGKSMVIWDILSVKYPREEAEAIWTRILNGAKITLESIACRPGYGTAQPIEITFSRIGIDGYYNVIAWIRDVYDKSKNRVVPDKKYDIYRLLADASPEMIYLIDTQGYVKYINPSAAKNLDQNPENIIGKHLTQLFPEELAHKHLRDVQKVIDSRQVFKGTVLEPFPIGEIWIDVTLTPVIDGENNVVGVLGLSNDVTPRKTAEEALKESEALFRSQFEFGNIGIAITSVNKGWLRVNRRLCEMFGYSEEELRQKTWSEMTYPEDLARDVEQFNRVLNGEIETYELDKRFIRKDGGILSTHLTVSCYRNPDRSVKFFIASFLDITERIKAEEARVEMERRLLHSQKLESLGVLAGGIAHDFNNLLAAIIGNLDIALTNIPEDSSAREDIEQALLASERATELTRQMLAYSGKGHFAIRQISLNEIIHQNADIFKAIIPKTITVNLELADTISLIVADQGQVQQVIMNLITNASEAIGPNPGVITIKTGAGEYGQDYLNKSSLEIKPPAGRYVFVEISDTGCGMDEETKHRLFEPFFTTKFTGRGLGMSAVSGIVSGHQGAIIIDSATGKGTTIRVLFPAYDISRTSLNAKSISPKPTAGQIRFPSGKILIVDDEEIVRKYTAAVVKRLGFETMVAANGEEALRLFRKNPNEFICVILDLTMPIMDGLTTFLELKKLNADQKVILLSGYSEKDATCRFEGRGLSGFLQKPFRLEELRDKLYSIFAGNEAVAT